MAEKLMGWTRYTGEGEFVSPLHEEQTITVRHADGREDAFTQIFDNWERKGGHPRLKAPDGTIYYLCPCQERNGRDALPAYSTDIAAAWQVVEKVGNGWRIGRDGSEYVVAVEDEPYLSVSGLSWIPQYREIARAPTAPHAICLAALQEATNG